MTAYLTSFVYMLAASGKRSRSMLHMTWVIYNALVVENPSFTHPTLLIKRRHTYRSDSTILTSQINGRSCPDISSCFPMKMEKWAKRWWKNRCSFCPCWTSSSGSTLSDNLPPPLHEANKLSSNCAPQQLLLGERIILSQQKSWH